VLWFSLKSFVSGEMKVGDGGNDDSKYVVSMCLCMCVCVYVCLFPIKKKTSHSSKTAFLVSMATVKHRRHS